ncbi:aldose 1-epimerase [Rhodopila sp.]|jgi:aldose 1-epimerase|uniref:aldose 1-epimerase n=1 Tax=Rhodopila sp. TaxID=2480087 RepID=UPI002C0F13AD|nr:aldose 1-epimerase [Rhodopila sp.]HVZ06916.1 aldose 1-epimerase [Rhodopila sp.]
MLTLRAGENAIVVAPETGGGVVGWMTGNTPVLRRAVPGAVVAGNPHVLGWFPLLPYANRIARGRFTWRGVDHRLTPNFGDSPHTIHGIGWQRPWSVEMLTACRARLGLDHAGDAAWPFAFRATLDYAVAPDSVTVGIALTNRAPHPAPAGLGLHPYFPKAHDPALRFGATGVWRTGPDVLPAAHGPVPADWRFDQSRRVTPMRLDNCFTGWDGRAAIAAGPASLCIAASAAFTNLQVFTPDWGDFFCAEPVSHVPDALNHAGLPADQAMACLAPGEALAGTIRLILSGRG